MVQITSTDLGASDRWIRIASNAALNNLTTKTVVALVRPASDGGGGFGYIHGKTPTGSVNGERLFVNSSDGWTFGLHSTGVSGTPQRATANSSISYNTWQALATTYDGTSSPLTATNIKMYYAVADGAGDIGTLSEEASYALTQDGSGSIYDDSANPLFLMNRFGLGRWWDGDFAYYALYNVVKNSTEINNIVANGPLSDTAGLVFLYANGQIYDPNVVGISIDSRSARVTGSLPNNVELGGGGPFTVNMGIATETDSVLPITPSTSGGGAKTVNMGIAVETSTALSMIAAHEITLDNSFEESSIDLAGSSVAGIGNDAIITFKPLKQASEVTSEVEKWLNPYFKITGVNGFRPSFVCLDHNSGAGGYHGYPFQAGRRFMYSYDQETWFDFDTAHTIGTTIEFRNSTAFTQDTVYVAWGPRFSVTQIAERLAALAAAFPTMVLPTAAAYGVGNVPPELAGWPAQEFISGMFSPATLGGRTSPELPFYTAWIDDPALQPTSGSKRAGLDTFGNHAGEPLGDIVAFMGYEWLCTSDPQAQNVRQNSKILIAGPINAPGRWLGGWRGSPLNGPGGIDDANRNFLGIAANTGLEIVDIPMQAILDALGGRGVQFSRDNHGAYLSKVGIYTDTAAHDTFLAALDPYVIPAITDKGVSAVGDVEQWAHDELGATFFITYEVGNPTPISAGDLTDWSTAYFQALSDLFDANAIPQIVEMGIASETDSALTITPSVVGGQTVQMGLAVETDFAFAMIISGGEITFSGSRFKRLALKIGLGL